MKKLLIALLCAGVSLPLSVASDLGTETLSQEAQVCITEVSSAFKKSPDVIKEILEVSEQYSYSDFPKQSDILAVIATESSFDHKALSLGNFGLMGLNLTANKKRIRSALTISEQIRIGSEMLRELYLKLKSPANSFLAYNVGLGGFLSTGGNSRYLGTIQKWATWFNRKKCNIA